MQKPKKGPHMEFGGPFGAAMMTLFLPATLYYINMACQKVNYLKSLNFQFKNIQADQCPYFSYFLIQSPTF